MRPCDTTVVTPPTWQYVLGGGVFTGLGGGAGALLPWFAGWWSGLPWVPLRGPAALLAAAPQPAAAVVTTLLGIAAGAAITGTWLRERLTVVVSAHQLEVMRAGRALAVIPRAGVSAVFLEREELVLLGRDTGELGRYRGEVPRARLAHALTAYGYRWCPEGDPHRSAYRRWVPDVPGLPDGADALLRARERALAGRDRADAEDLRAELSRLGVVVRDDNSRQYWRLTTTKGPR